MATLNTNAHVLIFPFPAPGHMIPILDFTHRLASAPSATDLAITICVTPKNLPFLTQLLSSHPRIQPLLLPFPPHPSIPSDVENLKDLPQQCLPALIQTLGKLYHPLLSWFESHPLPPSAIVSDMFLGWAQRLASRVGAKHIVFSPSGAMALSVMYSLWMDLPKLDDPTAVFSFDKIPNCPKYPWWQISGTYRACLGGDPAMEFIRDMFHGNVESWGLVVNSFSQLERPYFDHLKQVMGSDRVWAVGPLLPLHVRGDDLRGGSSSVSLDSLLTWLDTCKDDEVVYICFGSQIVLTNDQMAAVAAGLEKSGVRFVWSIKESGSGHVEENHGTMPDGFEDRTADRGFIIRGWAPQVTILSHRAVGAFLTHCGWNSVLEAVVAGVIMLTWPFAADQYVDQTLVVEHLKVAKKVCEGAESVPNSDELGRVLRESVSQIERKDVMELRKAAMEATNDGGSSDKDMKELVKHVLSSMHF